MSTILKMIGTGLWIAATSAAIVLYSGNVVAAVAEPAPACVGAAPGAPAAALPAAPRRF